MINTKAIPVTVTKGSGKRDVLPDSLNTKTTREKFFDTIFTKRWIIVLVIIFLVMLGLVIWLRRDKRKMAATKPIEPLQGINKAEEEILIAVEPLLDSQQKLEQKDVNGFYKTINSELKLYLSNKLNIPAATIDKKSISEALDKSGISLSTSLEIQKLNDEIEWQLYTPFSDESKMQELYERARMLIHEMNRMQA